jgi:hypothetical protein
MTDRPRFPETGDGNGTEYERGSSTGIRRWVKVAGIVAVLVVLLIVILVVLLPSGDGDGHGPGRHSSASPQPQPPTAVTTKFMA